MKVTPRFMIRAALVLTAGGVIGAFGACKDNTAPPPPPPPSPPSSIPAPSGLTATAVGSNQINLAWTDNATNETGFRVDRCSGAGCTNFAQVGANLAVNSAAFSDVGLVASTSYSYRVRAFSATDTSSWTPTATQTTAAAGGATSFTMVGAGEITTCASSAGPVGTAHLVDSLLKADANGIAFTVGNNLADSTPGKTFTDCFDPKWGTFKNRTYYSIGNGDFWGGRGPAGVYSYMGDRTGPPSKGWFSFNKGTWHIVVLNTSDWEHGGPATYGIDPALNPQPSEQVDWLANDLQTNTQPCVAVISWERRFYTTGTGTQGRNSNMRPMSSIMYDNGVDLLISAKDKVYSRFALMNPTDGAADPKGLRQFLVGTGGRTLDAEVIGTPANREANVRSWGVLKLTLAENSYSWEFVTNAGVADKSDAPVACH